MNAPCICPACGSEVLAPVETFDAVSGLVVTGQGAAQLSGREADYYSCLAATWPRLATRGFLQDWVCGAEPGDGVAEKTVDVYVCKLRKKLRPTGIKIGTVWGKGYRLVYPAPSERAA